MGSKQKASPEPAPATHEPSQEAPADMHPSHEVWEAQSEHGNDAAQEALSSRSGARVGQAPGPVKRLLDQVSTTGAMQDIAGVDGDAANISGVDWYMRHGYLPELIPVLQEHSESPKGLQRTFWFFHEMTELEPDPRLQRVYDLSTGALTAEALPENVPPEWIPVGSRAARRQLTAREQVVDNHLTGRWKWWETFDPVSGTQRDDFQNTVSDALAARERLASVFGFDPSDRSLEAVRAVGEQLEPGQLRDFIDDYLKAFFVSGAPPGAGLNYDYDSVVERGPAVFFGDPPGCDQLPDGRGIIDCKGFSVVSQLLFKELSRGGLNERGSTEMTYQFTVPNHQMALLRSGSHVIAIDNANAVELAMSPAELAHLDALHESTFPEARFGGLYQPEKRALNGPIDLQALPTLRAYVGTVFIKHSLRGELRANWYATFPVLK